MGGNAPFIVFDDANLDKAINGLMAAKYRNAGQVCVCPNRIYVQRGIHDEFIKKLSDRVAALSVGNGFGDVDLGCLISQKAVNNARSLVQDALDKGAALVAGGTTHQEHAGCFLPTIITNVTDAMRIANEEIFALIASVFVFDDEQSVIERANDTKQGLAAYFYTQDHARAWRVTEGLEVGMVAQNTNMVSSEATPFGGVKESGFGA
ncbi:Succinate-semialdehyde dehydrogenase [NADP(+)] GabD [Moraxella ovis]|nr:Succinate-semialdehyde dehydrogenase [NADP(+)] GabD [Moraxella ovis]